MRRIERFLKARLTRVAVLVGITFLTACSALPGRDLYRQYTESVRDLSLVPVYPPREEFQVGDVYLIEYDESDPDDIGDREREWLGSLSAVQTISNEYLSSRINFPDSDLTPAMDDFAIAPTQDDLRTSIVTLANGERRTLPLVSFPAVSGQASTAGTLGGYGFLRSFGLALGQNETVSLDFGDTRVFGLERANVLVAEDPRVAAEFAHEICPLLRRAMDPATDDQGRHTRVYDCPEGQTCELMIVTQTVLTRTLNFTYTNARIARLALSRLDSPVSETPSVLPIPGNLDVTVEVGPEADGEALSQLIAALSTQVQQVQSDVGSTSETSSLNFTGLTARGLQFQREFRKPVAVAYDAVFATPQEAWEGFCQSH